MTTIKFPDGEFTIADLEKANPGVPGEIVRLKLGEAIFELSVDFIRSDKDGTITYRKRHK